MQRSQFERKKRSVRRRATGYSDLWREMAMKAANDKGAAAERILRDPRWTDVLERNAAADGRFFYAVVSTGVYCRPSCAARRPRPENVSFHPTAQAAEQAGFHPCKRCTPDQPSRLEQQTATIAEVCRFIEGHDTLPSLDELAAKAGMSPHHFHRVFRKITGVTPRTFANAHRSQRMRQTLLQSPTITEALYDAGFNSNSRFYAASDAVLGMTPTAFRSGGVATEIRFAVGLCSLGSILVASSQKGVCAILLGDDPTLLVKQLEDLFPQATLLGADLEFENTVAEVIGLMEQPQLAFPLPLDIRGTAFQQRVWQALRQIPVGTRVSYTALAETLGKPTAVRAVAQACAANTLAVAIPCHRVVRADGTLAGYRWGVERKKMLLEREVAV